MSALEVGALLSRLLHNRFGHTGGTRSAAGPVDPPGGPPAAPPGSSVCAGPDGTSSLETHGSGSSSCNDSVLSIHGVPTCALETQPQESTNLAAANYASVKAVQAAPSSAAPDMGACDTSCGAHAALSCCGAAAVLPAGASSERAQGQGGSVIADASQAPVDTACPSSPSPCWHHGCDLRRHQVVRKLGSGGFSWVDLAAVRLADGSTRHIAVKNLVVQGGPERLRKVALREVEAMELMRGCPYGLELYGSTFDHLPEEQRGVPQLHYQLYLELAEKGTLKDELDAAVLANPRGKGNFRPGMLIPETRVAEVAHAVLSALQHLHSRGHAHCDVKPENIFVMADGGFRLGDPGVATAAGTDGRLVGTAGTYTYCSPEMTARFSGVPSQYPVTCQTDMFAVAQVLAQCCMWHDDVMAWADYMRWEKDLPTCVPDGLKQLVASMVEQDPAKRPTPGEALAHPWLVEAMRQVEKQRRWQQDETRTAAQVTAAVSRADAWW